MVHVGKRVRTGRRAFVAATRITFAASLLTLLQGCFEHPYYASPIPDEPDQQQAPAKAELFGVWLGMSAEEIPATLPNGRCEDKATHIECKAEVRAVPRGSIMTLTLRLEEERLTQASVWDTVRNYSDAPSPQLLEPLTQRMGQPTVGSSGPYGNRVHLWTADDGSEVALEGSQATLAPAGSAEQRRQEKLAGVAQWLTELVRFTPDGLTVLNGVRLTDPVDSKRCEPILETTATTVSGKHRRTPRSNTCWISLPHPQDPTTQELFSGTELTYDSGGRVQRALHRRIKSVSGSPEFLAEAIRTLPHAKDLQLYPLPPESAGLHSTLERLRVSDVFPGMVEIELTPAPPPDPIFGSKPGATSRP